MATTLKIYGAILGAGTQIREKSATPSISPSAIGWCGVGGILDRGEPGKVYFCPTLADARRKVGGRIADSNLPLSIEHFFKHAAGAGGLAIVRVTDGNEVKASIPLWQRKSTRTLLGRLDAKSGGRWAGAEKRYAGSVDTIATDITATTLDTGVVMKVDEWKGASLSLVGVPNTSYKVLSNDAAGVITVSGDSTMFADLTGGLDPTNARYYLELANGTRHLSAEIGDGQSSPGSEWSLTLYVNDERVISWPDLSCDPESPRYFVSVINDDIMNEFVTAVDTWEGAYTASVRPANYYGEFTALTDTVLTAKIHDFIVEGTGNPTVALGVTTDAMVAQTISIVMTSATAFTATSDVFGSLGTGSFGVAFVPSNKWIPPFTITAGDVAMTTADTISLVYKPLRGDLTGGRLYPNADAATPSYRIASNTHKTVTVAPASTMTTDVTVTPGVAASGSVQFVAQADLVDGESFVIPDGITTPRRFWIDESGTYTPVGGYNATNIRLDLSAATTAEDCAQVFKTAINAIAADYRVKATTSNGTGLMSLVNEVTGTQGNVTITESVANAGFLVVGMTGGANATVDEFKIKARVQAAGGRDGNSEISDADYIGQLWDVDASPFLRAVGRNMGVIRFGTPGITSDEVQKAGVAYAARHNHMYRVEIPDNLTTETAVETYLDSLSRNADWSHAVTSWPSYGYITDPDAPKKLKLISLTGMIFGVESAVAAQWRGYHKAAAGISVRLPDLRKLPTGDATLDHEFCNPRGINIIKLRQGNFILWGDRTLQRDNDEWKFTHHRLTMSWIEWTLFENFDWIIFAINDSETQRDAVSALRNFLVPLWRDRVLRGDTFEDAASIKIDAENNTAQTMAQGDMHAEIGLVLADTTERFIATLSRSGIGENAA
jgi:hypothetical protein